MYDVGFNAYQNIYFQDSLMSSDMKFPIIWYVQSAKAQTILCILLLQESRNASVIHKQMHHCIKETKGAATCDFQQCGMCKGIHVHAV